MIPGYGNSKGGEGGEDGHDDADKAHKLIDVVWGGE